jgi:uncharacterized membrane protein
VTSSAIVLALAVFGASAVEAVEALTIVLAAGTTRGWRSAAEGVVAALVVLVAIVAGVGVPLVRLVPIDVLRVVIGGLLLVLGLQWLRKAVLRASGNKALHDEDAIYASTVAQLSEDSKPAPTRSVPERGWRGSLAGPRDAIGFTVAFKGVFLEGLEVVLVVLTLGASSHRLGLAAAAAGAAIVVVTAVGFVVARQLSGVPENTMKTVVGIMLTSFGVFWVGEGGGLHWPGNDLAILGLIAWFAVVTGALVIGMRRMSSGAWVGGPAHQSQPAVAAEREVGGST